MELHVAALIEQASAPISVFSLQFHQPSATFLLLITLDHLGVEGHVLSEAHTSQTLSRYFQMSGE